jgi:hypothetical protein
VGEHVSILQNRRAGLGHCPSSAANRTHDAHKALRDVVRSWNLGVTLGGGGLAAKIEADPKTDPSCVLFALALSPHNLTSGYTMARFGLPRGGAAAQARDALIARGEVLAGPSPHITDPLLAWWLRQRRRPPTPGISMAIAVSEADSVATSRSAQAR